MTQAKPVEVDIVAAPGGELVDTDAEHDAHVDSVIAKFLSDNAEDEATQEDTDDEEPVDGDDEEPAAEAEGEPQEPEAEPAAKPKEDPPGDPERAKRIAAFAAKENELREREARLKEAEKAAQTKVASEKDLIAALARDPAGFLKQHAEVLSAAGVANVSDLAAILYYSELGDDAPAEYRKQVQDRAMAARLDALEKRSDPAQVAREAQERAAYQIRVETLDAELQDFSSAVSAEHFPNLAKFAAKREPEQVYNELAQIASHVIKSTGRFPRTREIAQALEAELGELAGIYASPASPTTQATESDEREPVKTLSDAETARRKKTRRKKRSEDMTDAEREDYAIQVLKQHMV